MEEAWEYGLPRGTFFVARRLELLAVGGRLWISWCVFGEEHFLRFYFFVFIRTNTAYCKYEQHLAHVPLLVYDGPRAVARRGPAHQILFIRAKRVSNCYIPPKKLSVSVFD